MTHPHTPILVKEICHFLDIQPDDIVFDGTLGYGGHAAAILETLSEAGKYIGVDQDPDALSYTKQRFKAANNIDFIHDNYANIRQILAGQHIQTVPKIILDLGLSSAQLSTADRGFSFQSDGPLDMRMNTSQTEKTAASLLNTLSEDELESVFVSFGELYRPKKFVSLIIEARKKTPICTVPELITLIKRGFYFRNKRSVYIRTCQQVFQALRIATNGELEALDTFLSVLPNITHPGSKIALMSFHSLEDRRIKRFLQDQRAQFKQCHKKVLRASQTEIRQNSRAKSAKCRIFERLS